MRLTPTKDQANLIAKVVNEPSKAALVAADTGFGKTLAATEIARGLNAQVVLVIAPLNTFDGWHKAVVNQELGLPVREIKTTKAGKQAYADLAAGVPGVYLIGRELFGLSNTHRPPNPDFIKGPDGTKVPNPKAGKGERKAWTRWSAAGKAIDLAIFDEVQAAQNRNSVTFSALKNLHPKFKLALSATPNGNQFEGFWAPTRWLWPNVIDRSYHRWVAEYCATEYSPYGQKKEKVTGERVPGRFVSSLPCYIYYEAPKVPYTGYTVSIEMSPAQKAMYESMEQASIAWLNERPLVVDIPLVQKIRLRQIALGEISFDEDGEIDFALDCASSKIDACQKIIAREGVNSIIFYTDSQKFSRVLAHRLGPLAREFSGEVSKGDRDKVKAAFISGDIKYLVATIPSIAEGVDGLQEVCHTEVWCNKSFNNMKNIQAAGRINRRGQKAKRITRYELVSAKSDDEKYLNRLVEQTVRNRDSLRPHK